MVATSRDKVGASPRQCREAAGDQIEKRFPLFLEQKIQQIAFDEIDA